MANPEGGGIVGFFKRLLHIEGERKAAKKLEKEARPEESKEKKGDKSKVALILRELDNVTPRHQAYEVLAGVKFEERTFTGNDELTNTLLEILNAPDTTVYHSKDWLDKKKKQLSNILEKISPGTNAHGQVNKVVSNFDTMIQKVDRNIRKYEIEEERKKASWLPKEDIGEIIEQTEEEKRDWIKDIENLPLEDEKIKQNILNYATRVEKGDIGDRGEILDRFQQLILSERREAIRQLARAQADPQETERIQKKVITLTRSFNKFARDFVEKYGSEKERFFSIIQGAKGEIVRNRILEDPDYRDYWFYHIIESIVYNKRSTPHRELYNLYVAGDMDLFLDVVRQIKDETTGERIGINMATRYEILLNTIFQSHDMDYYAAHPSQDMREFIGNTSLFLNQYIDAASQDPMVALAKRAYEVAMLQIRDTNNGYIPREWLAWEEGKMRPSKLDELAQQHLEQFIQSGQLYHVKMDDFSDRKLPAPSIWGRKQIDKDRPFTMEEIYRHESPLSEEWGRNLGDLRISSALKQAKGLALVDLRLLEIISQSKGTNDEFQYYQYYSSGDPEQPFNLASKQFNSIPYEGIVRHLEPIIHYYTRYQMGGEYYEPFFNMLVTEWPTGWSPDIMRKLVQLHHQGQHDEMIEFLKEKGFKEPAKVLSERLLAMDNPFEFSGMWGPFTKWRLGDSSIGFDDWERDQAYATSVKLMVADSFADRAARRLILEKTPEYKRFRNEFRQKMLSSDNIYYRQAAARDQAESAHGDFDDEFENYWCKWGIDNRGATEKGVTEKHTYRTILEKMWEKMLEDKDTMVFVKKLEKAYRARFWIQAAARHPLIVARELDVTWNKDGFKQTSRLRKKLLWELIGVDIDDIAAMRTPKLKEEAGFNRVAELEGALSAVEQIAIRENRDLRPKDFEDIIEKIKKSHLEVGKRDAQIRVYQLAKSYWMAVQDAMFGGPNKTAEQMYKLIGIEDAPTIKKDKEIAQGVRFHKLNSQAVNAFSDPILPKEKHFELKDVKTKIKSETALLTNSLLNRDWRHLFSTEDMGWEYLNINALGERNPVRRAGDLASHVQFGQLFEKYINDNLVGNPKIEDLVKVQKEMWTALTGDFLDMAYQGMGRIAYTTGMMYRQADWGWKTPFGLGIVANLFKDSSIMQMIRGRDRSRPWGPNDMLQYVHDVGGQQIVPKKLRSGFAQRRLAPNSEWYGGLLGKRLGATKENVVIEIINMTLLVAFLITLWRAFTAKSEEESQ
ncbi:hypothetical protein HYW54_02515 [Candidatus Gottesmanbacteria bacterium]|nr:hypothetical protein [Candidatus Gottesmanbacteria bacterium]